MNQSSLKGPCPHCGCTSRDQHSLTLAGICDGIRTGKVKKISERPLTVADGDGTITVYEPSKSRRETVEV